MAERFRKRPVEIEAVQLRWAQWSEVCELLGAALTAENPDGAWEIPPGEASDTCGEVGPKYIALNVRTAHGEIAIVRHGDWIIPEKQPGRFYPCKPDIFAETYESVAGDAEQPSAEETLAEVRRLQELTIACSCRAHAIEQAEDTLRILNRRAEPVRSTAPVNRTADRPPGMAKEGVAYETDTGRYVIADQGGWLTGSYDTADAARLAVSLDDEQLVELRDAINIRADRAITVTDLRAVLDRQADAERAHDLSHIPLKGDVDA